MNHDHFMTKAIEVAQQNPKAPFGTILVDRRTDEIVAEGCNQAKLNPTFHGEMVALNNFARSHKTGWEQLCLYTTAEPCCMCQAAIIWAGIPEVVFGTSISTLEMLGWNQIGLSAQQVSEYAKFATCKITGGVLVNECDDLFRRAKQA